jgi:arginase family enzyme
MATHLKVFTHTKHRLTSSYLPQVGIRSITDEGRKQAKKFNVRQIEMHSYEDHRSDLENLTLGEGCAGIYVSIDVDCLDPAFAPGGFGFGFGCGLHLREMSFKTECAFVLVLSGGLLRPAFAPGGFGFGFGCGLQLREMCFKTE